MLRNSCPESIIRVSRGKHAFNLDMLWTNFTYIKCHQSKVSPGGGGGEALRYISDVDVRMRRNC